MYVDSKDPELSISFMVQLFSKCEYRIISGEERNLKQYYLNFI